MLTELHISNYALIEETTINFDRGMSVITGETGAGKSILLGALGLLLGQKADSQVLWNTEKKCVVEATFDVQAYGLEQFFADNDVDYADQTIIRREILPTGKSRAFVNDSPVNVTFLKEMSGKIIDIHSQHQNLLLADGSFHLMVIDAVAGNVEALSAYQSVYSGYKKLLSEHEQLVAENNKMKQDAEYVEFQFRQLDDAQIKAGEETELEAERTQLTHSEEIKSELNYVVAALEADGAVLSSLSSAAQRVGKIQDYLPPKIDAVARLETARIDLVDLLGELQKVSEHVEYDPEKLTKIEQRLDTIYSLMHKHGVQDTEALIVKHQHYAAQLSTLNSFDEQIEALRRRIEMQREALTAAANTLSIRRKAVFAQVTDFVEAHLHDMGMDNARFIIDANTSQDFLPSGTDVVRFLFAANKSGTPADIAKVASGGEMSRVMLSIKSLLSKSKGLPTIIFDEIDTGVSGVVADKMGGIMTEMAENMQVVAITHLPQVAAKGRCHYKVFKTDTTDRTISNIQLLSHEERVHELAKMLSGASVTQAALQNARELLG